MSNPLGKRPGGTRAVPSIPLSVRRWLFSHLLNTSSKPSFCPVIRISTALARMRLRPRPPIVLPHSRNRSSVTSALANHMSPLHILTSIRAPHVSCTMDQSPCIAQCHKRISWLRHTSPILKLNRLLLYHSNGFSLPDRTVHYQDTGEPEWSYRESHERWHQSKQCRPSILI